MSGLNHPVNTKLYKNTWLFYVEQRVGYVHFYIFNTRNYQPITGNEYIPLAGMWPEMFERVEEIANKRVKEYLSVGGAT